nr:e9imm peptide [Streptomyces albireticuli]
MDAAGVGRSEAVVLVQRIMDADYAAGSEADGWLDTLEGTLGCPSGYLSDLIFWPADGELSADEVVEKALAYRPVAL